MSGLKVILLILKFAIMFDAGQNLLSDNCFLNPENMQCQCVIKIYKIIMFRDIFKL